MRAEADCSDERRGIEAMGGRQMRADGGLQRGAGADQTHADAFDGEIAGARIDDDRLEIRVLGQQLDRVAALPQAFDRDAAVDPGNHDLAASGLGRLAYGE